MVVSLPWPLLGVFDFPHTFCGLKETWYRYKPEAMWLKPTHKVNGVLYQISPGISYADHPQLQEEEVWQQEFEQVWGLFLSLGHLKSLFDQSLLTSFLKQWILCGALCYLQIHISAFPFHIHTFALFFFKFYSVIVEFSLICCSSSSRFWDVCCLLKENSWPLFYCFFPLNSSLLNNVFPFFLPQQWRVASLSVAFLQLPNSGAVSF